MATPSRLDVSVPPRHESLAARLVRLIALELELGWAETRSLVIRVAVALAVAVPAAIALLASIVVLAAGALAPLWRHRNSEHPNLGIIRARCAHVRRGGSTAASACAAERTGASGQEGEGR